MTNAPAVNPASTIAAEAFAGGKSLGLISLLPIGNGRFLRADAAYAFGRLRRKAEADSISLVVDSAFRTMPEQQQLWNQHKAGVLKTPVARPGFSNHQSGIALDIQVHASQLSPEYIWLKENAPGFGWHNIGSTFHPPEFWHWEFSSKEMS